MKAMVLAAGLGTRLRPITDTKPKALVTLNGTAMLDIVLQRLVREGYDQVIINVHHFARQVIDHLRSHPIPGVRIEISDETGGLLDTGGAIIKARWFLDGHEPFLVHNVDVISDIDLNGMMKSHLENDALSTLAVSERTSSRYFLFDRGYRLAGWEDLRSKEKILVPGAKEPLQRMAFSGIHVISPEIFSLLRETGRFSIVPAYLELAASGRIRGLPHPSGIWFDTGKPDGLQNAENYLQSL
jgi:NDP-sugar pyrophosphorylase family protein